MRDTFLSFTVGVHHAHSNMYSKEYTSKIGIEPITQQLTNRNVKIGVLKVEGFKKEIKCQTSLLMS